MRKSRGMMDVAGRRAQKAFTLIELLVVVAIIGVLAGLLLPVITAARAVARQTECASNLRQLFMAVESYKGNNDSYYPPGMSLDNNFRWHSARRSASDPWDHTRGPLYPYLQEGLIHDCPAFKALSGKTALAYELGAGGYGYNQQYVGGTPSWDLAKMFSPAKDPLIHNQCETILFGDAAALDPTTKELIEYGFVEAPFYEAWGMSKSDPSCHFRHRGRANFAFCDGHVQAFDKDFYLDVSEWTAVTVLDCLKNDLGYPCSDNALFDRW